MKFFIHIIAVTAVMIMAGCSGIHSKANMPEKRSLGNEYSTLVISNPDSSFSFPPEPTGNLSLRQAIGMALQRNPSLGRSSLGIRAKEALAYQASLYPNPELMVEFENFAGTGIFEEFNASETTISLGQMILLAGKIDKKTNVAKLESDIAAWEYEQVRLDVFTEVTKSYITVLFFQEQVKLNEELLEVASKLVDAIEKRVEAGQLSPAEMSRAKVEYTNSKIILQQSKRELKSAKIKLASAWNSQHPTFLQVEGELINPERLPDLIDLELYLKNNPEIGKWAVETKKRNAEKDYQESLAIPDLNVGLGYRRLGEAGNNAFVASISIPIPINNANQGAIEEAKIKVNQASWESASIRNYLYTDLSRRYESLHALQTEISFLQIEGIPEAQNAFRIINEGYSRGKFQFIDVLSAQRTLYHSKSNLLKSLSEYHLNLTDVERLIGQPISLN